MNTSQLKSQLRQDVLMLIDRMPVENDVDKSNLVAKISQTINDTFERQNAVKRGKL